MPDGGQAAGSFRGAGVPFVAVACEREAGRGSAFGFTDEGVERGGGDTFGVARPADFLRQVG